MTDVLRTRARRHFMARDMTKTALDIHETQLSFTAVTVSTTGA